MKIDPAEGGPKGAEKSHKAAKPQGKPSAQSNKTNNKIKLQEEFFQAASEGKASKMASLLAEGAQINGQDAKGWTALMMAAWDGHGTCVQLLLEKGAAREIRQENGLTVAKMAAVIGQEKVVELIEAQGLIEAQAIRMIEDKARAEREARLSRPAPARGGYKGRHDRDAKPGNTRGFESTWQIESAPRPVANRVGR